MGRRTSAQMYPLVELYEQGERNKRDFCEVHEINEATFTYWLSKYRSRSEEVSSFIPVEVRESIRGGHVVEVELTDGTILRFSDLIPSDYLSSILSIR